MSDSSRDDSATGDSSADDSQSNNWLEWTAFALGVAITLGVVGYLGYQIAFGSDEPATLEVTLQAPEASGETMFIPLEVENTGDRVAEEAVIEVCAGPDACGQISFTYIPKGSTRSGKVGLSGPLAAQPESRVVSYRTM